jgi:hypothetical protein
MALTFKRYTWGEYEANNDNGLAVAGVDWDGYSASSEGDWDSICALAGWKSNSETAIGILTAPWNGHPEGALIVSDDSRPGLDFAVSNEADS